MDTAKKYTKILFILLLLILEPLFGEEKEAQFYKKLDANRVKCLLCPKECILKDGQRGDCGVRVNKDGILYTLSYGRIAASHIDPIEKKPQYHFYPNEEILSIATAGCNLHCKFCQNWTLSQSKPEELSYSSISPEELISSALKKKISMIAYTYSEPVIFYEYMYECAKLAGKNGIKNVMVTAGYINEEPLKKLIPYLDAVTLDIKSMDNEYYRKEIGGTLNPVLKNAKLIYENNVWLELVYLVIPGINDDDGNIDLFLNWIKKNLSIDVPIHFLRFFPNYKMYDLPPTPASELSRIAKKAADLGFHFIYIGNLRTDKYEDTYCPKCEKKLIDRSGYIIKYNKIKNGKCPYCGKKIAGRFK